MAITIGSRIKHAWNAFLNRDPTGYKNYGPGYYHRPDRPRLSRGNEKSIVTSIYNKMAIDVAAIDINHCRLDSEGRFDSIVESKLNNCLSLEANIDQTARAFRQDIVMSMFDEGTVAIIPIDTDDDPTETNSYGIETMRTGKIMEWMPRHVRVKAYDDRNGRHSELILPKSSICIIENPLYPVMNETNSTLQRLIRKLNILDAIDEQSGSGKLDLIIQLPYVIKTEARRKQADDRKADIERQLRDSKFGIAYTDGTEKITQLNRSVDNNLMHQIEYLTNTVYSQLGLTQAIMDNTADEAAMNNYYNRTIEPIISAITDEMKRKFLTKTARTQGQSILFFRDPFKLIPVGQMADLSDKLTRNEILTSNEVRQKIGFKPSKDPKADELVNSNISQPTDKQESQINEIQEEGDAENGI